MRVAHILAWCSDLQVLVAVNPFFRPLKYAFMLVSSIGPGEPGRWWLVSGQRVNGADHGIRLIRLHGAAQLAVFGK